MCMDLLVDKAAIALFPYYLKKEFLPRLSNIQICDMAVCVCEDKESYTLLLKCISGEISVNVLARYLGSYHKKVKLMVSWVKRHIVVLRNKLNRYYSSPEQLILYGYYLGGVYFLDEYNALKPMLLDLD